jgi:DedD protein
MSAERKKLLWISVSACIFVLIVLAVGFFLMSPKKGSAQAPATIGNSAPPKAQDPQDFLSSPPAAPALEQPQPQNGNMIVVYGDNPKPGAGAAAGSAGATPSAPSSSPSTAAAAEPSAPSGDEEPGPSPTTASPPAKKEQPKTAKAKPAPKAAQVPVKPAMAKVDEYWIQAASFTSRGRADELKQGLAEKGMAALITVKDISGKSYYRVRVGPYSGRAEADGWLERLKALQGCAEAYVSKTSVLKPKK